MATKITTRIRMHRMGELGDCFLLTFTAGQRKSHMLIDCGTFRNGAGSKTRIREVVTSIRKELKGKPLDVVVGTHQHNDHLNGFVHAQDLFADSVDQVWLSWLDDPEDAEARVIATDYNNLRANLVRAAAHLKGRALSPQRKQALDRTEGLLGFFVGARHANGTPSVLPEQARKNLQAIGKKEPRYLHPGQSIAFPSLPANSVRVHVLGPPHERSELERMNPRKGESYDKHLSRATAFSARFADALTARALDAHADKEKKQRSELREEMEYPFANQVKRKEDEASGALKDLVAGYRHKRNDWRLADDDWLDQCEGLALWLDDYTNNSSLVLAIELVASKKVLLFAADAQTGNWSSWKDIRWKDKDISTADLLARTVLYKVGHHGSHNSTHAEVFEQMTDPRLSALIPVDKTDGNIAKDNGWRMPAEQLFARIKAKTRNRALQMDGDDDPACDPKKKAVKDNWKKAGFRIKTDSDLFIELTL